MNAIRAVCAEVAVTCRGPKNKNLRVVFDPDVKGATSADTLKDREASVLSGHLIIEIPNEDGQHSTRFVEGQVYEISIAPAPAS